MALLNFLQREFKDARKSVGNFVQKAAPLAGPLGMATNPQGRQQLSRAANMALDFTLRPAAKRGIQLVTNKNTAPLLGPLGIYAQKSIVPETRKIALTPRTRADKFIFGSQPVPTLQGQLKGNIFPKLGKASLPVGIALTAGGLGADLFPGGSGKGKKVFNAIAKSKNARQISKLSGITDDTVLKKLVKETNVNKIGKIMGGNSQGRKTIKLAQKGLKGELPLSGRQYTQSTKASQANLKTIDQTYPDSTTPIKLLQGRNEQKLLNAGRPTTAAEAKKIFKKTGEAVDFTNVKKPTNKIAITGKDVVIKNSKSADNYLKKVGYDDMVGEVKDLNDIGNISKGFKDVYRNFKSAFGDRFPQIKKAVLDPFDNAKSSFVDDQVRHVTELKKNIVDGLGITKGSKESAATQRFGEGILKYDDLLKKFGKKKADNIVQADQWFRKSYDELLDQVNATRAAIYPNNPDKIIPKRKDYYRHFTEMQEGFAGLKNIFDTPSQIASQLSGTSEFTKPKSKWLSFAQQRLGGKTEFDAVGGYLDYIKAQTYAKNIDPQIDVFRQLRDSLARQTETGKDAGKLNNLVEYLDDFANDLAGKTNPLDRGFQKWIPGGRKAFKAINWLNNRVKANVILGNASSSIAQIFNVPQGLADAGPVNFTKGIGKSLSSIFTGGNTEMKMSRFIKERYSSDIYNQFDKGMLSRTRDFAAWMVRALDEVGTKAIWNGEYQKGLTQGLKGDDIIRFADDATRRMVAGRGVGEVPLAQKSRVFQMVAPFQLEVANLWHVMKDMVDERAFGKLAVLFVSAHVFNKGAEKVRGSGVMLDPIEAMMDAFSTYQEEDDKKIGAIRAGGRAAGEVLSNVPLGQTLAQLYPEYGMKIPGTDENLTRKELFGREDPTRFGGGPLFTKGLKDPLYKVLPPFAGQQLKRTLGGVGSTLKGYKSVGDKVQFPIEQNAINLIKSGLFGEYSTKEGQQYSKEERSPLGENQSEIFKLGGGKDYYNKVMGNREVNKESKKTISLLKEGKKSKAEDLGNGVYGLSNGKFYSKGLDKSFDTQEDAKLAITKDQFDKSGKNFQDLGDTVLKKSSNGNITTQKKTEYNDSLYYQQMTQYKKRGDLENWMKTAEKKALNLEEMLKDPSLDDQERIKLENRLETLITDAQKYQGGFKKVSLKKGKTAKPKKPPKIKIATKSVSPNIPSMPQVKKISLIKKGGTNARRAKRQTRRGIKSRELYG